MNAPELIRLNNQCLKLRQESLAEHDEEKAEWQELDGVKFRYHPFNTSRNTDIVQIEFENGYRFATEYTFTPWSIFKPIRIWHSLNPLYETKGKAQRHLDKAGVKGEIHEDPYADPTRYYIDVGEDFEDVIKMYKTREVIN